MVIWLNGTIIFRYNMPLSGTPTYTTLATADVGDAVAERLATMHPTSAAAYRVAAARLRERLIALDAEAP
jgi:hypothetical protein